MEVRTRLNLFYLKRIRIGAFVGVLMALSVSVCASTTRNDRDIIAICDSMGRLADNQDYIEKQMEWQDALQRVTALAEVMEDAKTTAWRDYYIQLYRMLIYFDPAKSMDRQRIYMVALDNLIHRLPQEHQALRWYAARKLSRLFNLDNNQQKSFELLEETVQDVLGKEHRNGRDTLCLAHAMVGQLFCYKVIPKKIGRRNTKFLETYPSSPKAALGLALYRKNYKKVVRVCEEVLQSDDLKLIERYYFHYLLEDVLANTSASNQHATSMLRLIKMHKKLQQDISERLSFDYKKYQELQEKSRIEVVLQQEKQKHFIKSARRMCVLGLIIVTLLGFLWFLFYKSWAFRDFVLKKVKWEQEEKKKALVETQNAYAAQVELMRNLNHDIRVPLNSLIGFSDILSSDEKVEAEVQHEAAEVIRQSSRQLLYIINNLLSIARLSRNKMAVNIDVVTVGQLVDPALEATEKRA